MSEKHFRLVFAGEVANDTDVATVQAAMAEKFKLPEAQVAALFGGRRAVLKKDLDATSAKRYQQAFAQIGALVTVEPMSGSAAASAPPPPPPAGGPALEGKDDDAAPASAGMALEPTDRLRPGQRTAPDLGGPTMSNAPPAGAATPPGPASPPPRQRIAPDLGGPAPRPTPEQENDPYAPPSVQQLLVDVDNDDSTAHAPVMVGIGRGWSWIAEAMSLFGRNPGAWIGLIVVTFVLLMVLGLIPIVNLLASVIFPILIGGMMIGVHRSARGGDLEVGDLFEGFKSHAVPLALVGLAYLVSYIVVLGGVFTVVIGGGAAMGLLAGDGEAFAQMVDGGEIALVGIIILLTVGLTLPIMAMIWFSPALIVLHDVPVLRALGWSIVGCLKNVLPFLLYSIIMLVASIIATLPLMLGWLVLGPILVASIYTAYRDIYLDEAS